MAATDVETSMEGSARRGPRRARGGLTFLVRYFLRYGVLAWALAIQLGVEVAVLFQRGGQWRGDLLWTLDWVPVALVVVGPVAAGLAAIDTARLSVGAAHLERGRVSRAPTTGLALAYATCIGAVHLVVVTGALVASQPPVGDPFAPLAVLVQLLILAFFVALGTAVGRFVGPVLAGLAAAGAAFVAVYLASSPGDQVALLAYGGATVPRIGYAYAPGFLVAQAVMLALACLALLVVRPVEGRRVRRVSRRDGWVAGALVVAVGVISFAAPSERLRPIDATATFCGAVQAIGTCFYPQHERVAEPFKNQFWVLVSAARENGYDALLPRQVVEASMTGIPQDDDPSVAAFYVQPDHLQGTEPSLWEIASGIVQPIHCPQVQGDDPPSDLYWEDLNALTATWVDLAEPGTGEAMGYFGEPLDPQEAATLVDEFRTCTYADF